MYRKLGRDLLGENSKDNQNNGDTSAVDPFDSAPAPRSVQQRSAEAVFHVSEILGEWVRPNIDRMMYPYLPAHISEAKEKRTIFLVRAPEEAVFTVREPNVDVVAVPLFELYENAAKYGSVLASLPQLLSRLLLNLC
jgi:cleavage and polyadenylation specificity factor subunit 5